MRALFTLGTFFALIAGAWAHQGHSTPAPWTACAHSELGEACAWKNSAGDLHRGTCRAVSESLLCVRNRPVERAAERASAAPAKPAPEASRFGTPLAIGASAVCVVALGFGLGGAFRSREGD